MRPSRLFAPLAALALAAGAALADTHTWNGSFDTAWTTAANWTPLGPPSAGDTAVIPAGTPGTPRIAGGTENVGALTVQLGAGLILDPGGSLDVSGALSVAGSIEANTAGSLIRVGGNLSLTNSTASIAAATPPELYGAGTCTIASGTSISHLRVVDGVRSFGSSFFGILELLDGTLHVNDAATVVVETQCLLTGGTLSFDTAVGNLDVLDVNGLMIFDDTVVGATSSQSRIRCSGLWSGGQNAVLPNGWVELDGVGSSDVNNSVPGGTTNTHFGNLRIANGERILKSTTVITGALDIETNASLNLFGTTLDVAGTLDTTALGAAITGSGGLRLTGTGELKTNTTPLPPTTITGGTRSSRNAHVSELTLELGNLHLLDAATLTVEDDLRLEGGTLSFDNTVGNGDFLDVDGDLIQIATTVGSTTAQSLLRVAGNWSADTAFVLPNGWVELDGGAATIGGAAPAFHRLRLKAGDKQLLTDVEVSGVLVSQGGTTSGSGWFDVLGGVENYSTGANLVNRLRMQAGTAQFSTSRLGELEIVGGTLHVRDAVTLTVEGDARLLGGTLSFDTTVGNGDRLVVQGNVTESGTQAGTTTNLSFFHCAGDWSGDGSFVMPNGRVQLDGAGTTTIGGAAPTFGTLWIENGTRALVAPTLVQTRLEVRANASVDLSGQDLEVVGDLYAQNAGASIVGDGPIELSGSGELWSANNAIPALEITGGTRNARSSRVAALRLVGGNLHFLDTCNLLVQGVCELEGGTLSFDTLIGNGETLDVEGDLIQTATLMGSSSAVTRIRCAGDWSAQTPFELANGWVELDGQAQTVSGADPRFARLELDSGVVTIESETRISKALISTGGSTTGPEWVVLVDTTQPVSTGANLVHQLRVAAGLVRFATSKLGALEIAGGTLHINDAANVSVTGAATLTGGTLSFDTTVGNFDILDVDGPFTQTGTVVGSTSTQSLLRISGGWSSSASFVMPNGWVEFDGGAQSLAGADPRFGRMRLKSGVLSVDSEARIQNALVSTGGSTAGEEWLVMEGASEPVNTGANLVNKLRVAGGTVQFFSSRLGQLELVGGTLHLRDAVTLSVEGDATLAAGQLSFDTTVGNQEFLDVDGSLHQIATTVSAQTNLSRIRCAGDWSSNSSFGLTQGQVDLDGAGTTQLSGSLPGLDPSFPVLRILNGTREVPSTTFLSASSASVLAGARLRASAADSLHLVGTPLSVSGTLDVEPGARATADPASSILVNNGGRLELVGQLGLPAVLAGEPDSLNCTVNGTLAASYYEVHAPAAGGFVLGSTASLAAAPEDLRGGLFTAPSASPGSTLVQLSLSGSPTFQFTRFEDPLGVGSFNARRSTGGVASFQNFTGAFGGELFEDDAGDRIEWLPASATEIAGFSAKPGPEEVSLEFTTTLEVDVASFRLESASSAAGPFSLVASLAPQGPSTYGFTHLGLAPDQLVHYRLVEEQTSGFLRLLGSAEAQPYSADTPANVRTVGPGGEFATIQEAIDAASAASTVISVAAGSYPAFQIDAPGVPILRVLADGSGPIAIDASAGPLTVQNVGFGQLVELSGLDVSGGAGAPAVLLANNLGTLLLDGLDVVGGGGGGLELQSSFTVAVQRCDLAGGGQPGLRASGASRAYVGRGSLDALELGAGSSAQLDSEGAHV